jgi:hypothetical protein
MTVRAARALARRLSDPRFEVLFDHGDPRLDSPQHLGHITSWFGEAYAARTQLALLDIAVVDRQTGQAIVLVEIEETSSSPKVAIGDAFGTLLGDHIAFQGTRGLAVGDFTALLILLRDSPPLNPERTQYLEHQIAGLAKHAHTGNAAIGQIALRLFRSEGELVAILSRFVAARLAGHAESSQTD